MKKTFILSTLLFALLLTSCSTFHDAGEDGFQRISLLLTGFHCILWGILSLPLLRKIMLAFQGGATYYNGMETEEDMAKSGSAFSEWSFFTGLSILLVSFVCSYLVESAITRGLYSVGIGVVLGLAIVLILKNTSAWTIVKKVVQIGGIVMFAAGVIMLFAGFAQL